MICELEKLDILAIEKGDYFEPAQIAAVTGTEIGTQQYTFAKLSLQREMERNYLEIHGILPTIKSEKDGLRVLTDDEAVTYNDRRGEQILTSYARTYRRNRDINRANLTSFERQQHDRVLMVQSRTLQAIRACRKELKVEPHVSSTPRPA